METDACLEPIFCFEDVVFSKWYPFNNSNMFPKYSESQFKSIEQLEEFLRTFDYQGEKFIPQLKINNLYNPQGENNKHGNKEHLLTLQRYGDVSYLIEGKGMTVYDATHKFKGHLEELHVASQCLECKIIMLGHPNVMHNNSATDYYDSHLILTCKNSLCKKELLQIGVPYNFKSMQQDE